MLICKYPRCTGLFCDRCIYSHCWPLCPQLWPPKILKSHYASRQYKRNIHFVFLCIPQNILQLLTQHCSQRLISMRYPMDIFLITPAHVNLAFLFATLLFLVVSCGQWDYERQQPLPHEGTAVKNNEYLMCHWHSQVQRTFDIQNWICESFMLLEKPLPLTPSFKYLGR